MSKLPLNASLRDIVSLAQDIRNLSETIGLPASADVVDEIRGWNVGFRLVASGNSVTLYKIVADAKTNSTLSIARISKPIILDRRDTQRLLASAISKSKNSSLGTYNRIASMGKEYTAETVGYPPVLLGAAYTKSLSQSGKYQMLRKRILNDVADRQFRNAPPAVGFAYKAMNELLNTLPEDVNAILTGDGDARYKFAAIKQLLYTTINVDSVYAGHTCEQLMTRFKGAHQLDWRSANFSVAMAELDRMIQRLVLTNADAVNIQNGSVVLSEANIVKLAGKVNFLPVISEKYNSAPVEQSVGPRVAEIDQGVREGSGNIDYAIRVIAAPTIFPHDVDKPGTYEDSGAADPVYIGKDLSGTQKRKHKRNRKLMGTKKVNPISKARKPKFRHGLDHENTSSLSGDGYAGQYHPDDAGSVTPNNVKSETGWFYDGA